MRRLLLVSVLALAVAATAAAAVSRAKVGVRHTSLGRVLVDPRGHTLYVFDLDRRGKVACSGACAALWPPFLTSGKPLAAAGVAAAKLGMVRRGDGRLQVTFAGHPLYFFARDTKAGQVNGAAIPHWAALSATGAKLRPAASSSSSPSTGGSTTPTTTAPPPSYGGGDGY
jgi:predicted lipoprotein with Yx(FWY)xxD motif